MTVNAKWKIVNSKGKIVTTFRNLVTARRYLQILSNIHMDKLEIQPIENE
jgi:hypothetical protein